MTPEVKQAADSLLHQIAVIRFNQHDSDEVEQSWCAQVEAILAALAHMEAELQAEKRRGAELAEALKAIADELRQGNKAITDTVWMSDELNTTMLELIEHTLESHAEGKHP